MLKFNGALERAAPRGTSSRTPRDRNITRVNRRFAKLYRASNGGSRPDVIPHPSWNRTRARSRAISRFVARSFRKTSREILFATLSTLASDALTHLDVRARRSAFGALLRGKKRFRQYRVRRATVSARATPRAAHTPRARIDKRPSPTRPPEPIRVQSGAHTPARDRVAHLSAVALCVKVCIMFVSGSTSRCTARPRLPSPVVRPRAPRLGRAERPLGRAPTGFYDWALFYPRIARVDSYSRCF